MQNHNHDQTAKNGLAPVTASSLLIGTLGGLFLAAVILALDFLHPGKATLLVMLAPLTGYVAAIGAFTAMFYIEWRLMRAHDRRGQKIAEAAALEATFHQTKVIYQTCEENEAKVYLLLGWQLLKVLVRMTDVHEEQPAYVLGWMSTEPAPRPQYDSKTRTFTV